MADPTSGIRAVDRRRSGLPLERLARAAAGLGGVRRTDLRPGDRVVVSTKNSVYSLTSCADGRFIVSGGWYELQKLGTTRTQVLGCTAGGRALFTEHVAAPGLFLEFEDGLRTTRIRTVRHIPADPDRSSLS
jgi:hypothetical protein